MILQTLQEDPMVSLLLVVLIAMLILLFRAIEHLNNSVPTQALSSMLDPIQPVVNALMPLINQTATLTTEQIYSALKETTLSTETNVDDRLLAFIVQMVQNNNKVSEAVRKALPNDSTPGETPVH